MKNRIWKRAKSLGLSAILFTAAVCGNWGQTAEIKASNVDKEELGIVQTAQWMEGEAFRAAISMEVNGLLAYRENHIQRPDVQEESDLPQEETVEGVTEEPADSAQSCRREEDRDSEPGQEEWQEEGTVMEEEFPEQETRTEQEEWEELKEEEYEEACAAGYAGKEPVFEEGYEEVPQGGAENPEIQLLVENYISEFFQPIEDTMPESSWIEEVNAVNQKGEAVVLYKVVYPVKLSELTEDRLRLDFEAVLREEYRYPAAVSSFPISQDEPLNKDCAGTGMHLLEIRGMDSTILAQGTAPVLEVAEGTADFELKLKSRVPEIKAGNSCVYEMQAVNTGDMNLKDIVIKSEFESQRTDPGQIKAVWEAGQGVQVQGRQAVIPALGRGETVSLYMTVQLDEGEEGRFVHKVTAQAASPQKEGEIIRKEVLTEVNIIPLKADFTVEKTADRTEAYPGDTVNYQICIRNTGERTLHSVLSTERFLGASVQAKFLPKEGVTLNASGTQALIEKIAPGETFALQASVTLPQYVTSQELINQVTVISKETGTKTYESQSRVNVTMYTPTPTINPYNGYQVDYQSSGLGKSAYSSSSQPKTGDNTEIRGFLMLLSLAVLAAAGVFWKRKGKSSD